MIDVCPDCDKPKLSRCGTGINGQLTAKWRCQSTDCDWTGDDPKTREAHQGGSASGGSKLAAKLERASPDGEMRADD